MTLTIHEVASKIQRADSKGQVTPSSPSVVEGLVPTTPPKGEGLVALTPAQASSVKINRLTLNGDLTGYQREARVAHVREMARAMAKGRRFPAVDLALDESGDLLVVDGQHRLLASIVSRQPVLAVIQTMTAEEQAARFADQRKAAAVDRNILILAGSSPAERYIQEAVKAHSEGDEKHPWSELVALHTGGRYLSANQVHQAIVNYCSGALGRAATRNQDTVDKAFKPELADELGRLLRSIGTRRTSPYAFEPRMVRGLVNLATLTVRRSKGSKAEAIDRWSSRMATFPFADWRAERSDVVLVKEMVRHWNWRLSDRRRVEYP